MSSPPSQNGGIPLTASPHTESFIPLSLLLSRSSSLSLLSSLHQIGVMSGPPSQNGGVPLTASPHTESFIPPPLLSLLLSHSSSLSLLSSLHQIGVMSGPPSQNGGVPLTASPHTESFASHPYAPSEADPPPYQANFSDLFTVSQTRSNKQVRGRGGAGRGVVGWRRVGGVGRGWVGWGRDGWCPTRPTSATSSPCRRPGEKTGERVGRGGAGAGRGGEAEWVRLDGVALSEDEVGCRVGWSGGRGGMVHHQASFSDLWTVLQSWENQHTGEVKGRDMQNWVETAGWAGGVRGVR